MRNLCLKYFIKLHLFFTLLQSSSALSVWNGSDINHFAKKHIAKELNEALVDLHTKLNLNEESIKKIFEKVAEKIKAEDSELESSANQTSFSALLQSNESSVLKTIGHFYKRGWADPNSLYLFDLYQDDISNLKVTQENFCLFKRVHFNHDNSLPESYRIDLNSPQQYFFEFKNNWFVMLLNPQEGALGLFMVISDKIAPS